MKKILLVALAAGLCVAATVKISEIGRHLPALNATNYFPLIVNGTNATVTYGNIVTGAVAMANLVNNTALGLRGTNYPPVLPLSNNTNSLITVGSGTRQFLYRVSATNFSFAFSGSGLNGEDVWIAQFNPGTSDVSMTNVAGIYDPTVGYNSTTFAIAAGSARFFHFNYMTTNGSTFFWALVSTLGKQYTLGVAGNGLQSVTNGGTILISNGPSSYVETVAGAGNGSTNYTLFNNGKHKFFGSSNVNIVAFMGYTGAGAAVDWGTCSITNLSGSVWGFSIDSTTNQIHWLGLPITSLPAGSETFMAYQLRGSNVFIGAATNLNPVAGSW